MTTNQNILSQSTGIRNADDFFERLKEIFGDTKLSPATMEAIQRLFATVDSKQTPTDMAEKILDCIKSDPNFPEIESHISKAIPFIEGVLENTPDGFFVAAIVRGRFARLKLPQGDQRYVGTSTFTETRAQELIKGAAFTTATGAMTFGFQQAMMGMIERYYAEAMNAREASSFWELAKNGGNFTTVMTSAISALAAVGIQLSLSAAQKYDWSRRLREVMLGQEWGKKHAKKGRNYVTWSAIAVLAGVLTVEVGGLAKHTAQSVNVGKASYDVGKKIQEGLSASSPGSEAARLVKAYTAETANIKAYADKFYKDETSGPRAGVGARAVAKYALTDLYGALADPRLNDDPVLKAAVQQLLDDIDGITQNAEFRAIPSFAGKAEWLSSLVMGNLADLESSGTNKFNTIYKAHKDGKDADSADFYAQRNAFDKEGQETIVRLNDLLGKWGKVLDAYQRFATVVTDRSNATSKIQIPAPPGFTFVTPNLEKVMSDVASIKPELEGLSTIGYITKVWELTGVEGGISKGAALLFWLSVFIRSGLVEGLLIGILGRLRNLREKHLSEPGKTIHQQRTHVRSYYYDMIGEIHALYDTSIRPQLPAGIPSLSPSDIGYLVDALLVKIHPECAVLFSHKNTETFGKRLLNGAKLAGKTALLGMNFDTLTEREIKILDAALLKLTDASVIREHVQTSLFAKTHDAATPNQIGEVIRQFESQSKNTGYVFENEKEARQYAERIQKWYNTDSVVLDAMKSANSNYMSIFQMFEEQLRILVRDPIAFGRQNYFDLNVGYHVISQLLQKHSHPEFWVSSGNKPIHSPVWINRKNKAPNNHGQIGLIGGYVGDNSATVDELEKMIIVAQATLSANSPGIVIIPSNTNQNLRQEDYAVPIIAIGMPEAPNDIQNHAQRTGDNKLASLRDGTLQLPMIPTSEYLEALLQRLESRKLNRTAGSGDDESGGEKIDTMSNDSGMGGSEILLQMEYLQRDGISRNALEDMTQDQARRFTNLGISRIECTELPNTYNLLLGGVTIVGTGIPKTPKISQGTIERQSVYIEQDVMILPTLPNTGLIQILIEYLENDKPEQAMMRFHNDLSDSKNSKKGDAIRQVFVKNNVLPRNPSGIMTLVQADRLAQYGIFRIQCMGVADTSRLRIGNVEIAGVSVARPSESGTRNTNTPSLPVRSIVLGKTNNPGSAIAP